jgi:dethiobiotin synthetase
LHVTVCALMVSSDDLNLMTDDLRLETFLLVGTDTGVGKTVFSGLFARYLMDAGVGVRAVKPFCSGGMEDVDFLVTAHGAGLGQEDLNFWYSDEPISPAAWERRHSQTVDFEGATNWINSLQSTQLAGISSQPLTRRGKASLQSAGGSGQAGVLLVEGVGGLLAPLAKGKTVASLGKAIGAQLIVVAPNRVGVINQVLLTVEAAAERGLEVACVVFVGQKEADASSLDNASLLRDFLPVLADFKGVFELPWLGLEADDPGQIGVNVKKVEKVLAEIYEACRLRGPSGSGVSNQPSG